MKLRGVEMNAKVKMIGSLLIFGSIGVFIKNIDLPSTAIALLRGVIGSLFLVCAGLVIRQKISLNSIKENALMLIMSGIGLGLNWVLFFQAFKYTTVPNATLSYYFAPVFVMILSPFILKEKITSIKIFCIVMAMTGLLLIVNVGGPNIDGSYNHLKGILFGLSAASAYATVVLMNKFIKNLSGFETTLMQLAVASVVLLLSVLVENNLNLAAINSKAWIFILILGVVHTGIGFLLYFSSMKELNAQSIAILSYIDPISAVIIAAMLLGETMTAIQMVGGVLILGSTFLSERVEVNAQKLDNVNPNEL
jgi:RarD protein